jgi:hypothetical protein
MGKDTSKRQFLPFTQFAYRAFGYHVCICHFLSALPFTWNGKSRTLREKQMDNYSLQDGCSYSNDQPVFFYIWTHIIFGIPLCYMAYSATFYSQKPSFN